jgi:hypothetical protein
LAKKSNRRTLGWPASITVAQGRIEAEEGGAGEVDGANPHGVILVQKRQFEVKQIKSLLKPTRKDDRVRDDQCDLSSSLDRSHHEHQIFATPARTIAPA